MAELLDQMRLSPHLSTSHCDPGSLGMGGDVVGTDSFWIAGWLLSPLPCPASPHPAWFPSQERKEGSCWRPCPAPGPRAVETGSQGRGPWLENRRRWMGEGKEKSGNQGSPQSGHAITLLYIILSHDHTCRVVPAITQSPKSSRRCTHGRAKEVERQGPPLPPCPWHC